MVAFEDHFWGEKYNGFEVLHSNFKQGSVATKEFLDFVKERVSVEETYAKALQKIAHKCPTAFGHIGSFDPCWKFVQVTTEKLASIHLQVIQNLNEVAKALKEYGDTQKEKQKQLKEEFNSMSEFVQSMQALNSSVAKAKEAYQAKSNETEKTRKECTTTKELPNLERVESKLKKSCEEYKSLLEKRETTRNDYEAKFTETAKKFETLEHEHLTELLAFLGKYGNCMTTERVLLDQIIEEFSRNMDAFRVSSLLEQFVCAKETGKEKPAPMEFQEINLSVPPVDVEAITSKEVEKRKAKKERKTKKKKEKATTNGTLQTPEDPQKPENIEVDEDGYSIRPVDADSASLRSGKSRDSFSSGSGSDFVVVVAYQKRLIWPGILVAAMDRFVSTEEDYHLKDDDEPRKIQVKIKPKDDTQAKDISIDALKTLSAGLTLSSPGTVHKRLNTGSNLDMASKKLSRSNNALLDLEHSSNSDTASIKSLPSSTSLDAFQPTFLSNMSDNASKDSSSNDFGNLFNTAIFDTMQTTGNSDWASDLVTNDVPKSTSETRGDADESPPPLPSKNRAIHEEANTLPRSSKVMSPTETGSVANENNNSFEKPVALPRLKTISGGQFPTLAPPINSRRNTSGARMMQNRPLPPPPQPTQQPQSSLFDLMDVFTAPAAPSSNSSPNPSNPSPAQPISTSLSQSLNNQSLSLQTAGLVSPATTSEPNGPPVSTDLTRGDVQASPVSSSLMNSNNAVQSSKMNSLDRATPIAVAFIETVNARLKVADPTQPMVKITGDMTLSFPSSIIPVLLNQTPAAVLKFDIHGTNSLEQIFPNKALVEKEGQLPGGDTLCYKFNMAALAAYLKKQSEQNSASYYNIDIIKYQVRSNGIKSVPLQLRSYWRCDQKMTDLKIDYEYNPTCVKPPSSLSNVSVIVPVDGGVEIMHSKPSASWSGEHQRAVWKIPIISQNSENKGSGSLRARFEVSSGPSTPASIAVQFTSEGTTISNMTFDLKSPAYKLSLVKKKFASGKYLAEPITIADKS